MTAGGGRSDMLWSKILEELNYYKEGVVAKPAKDLHLESVTVDLSSFLALCNKNFPQPEQNNYEVSRDSIRRICYAIEEYNALYLVEDFARQTRWGGIIAPPGYLFSHGRQFVSWPSHMGESFVDSEGRQYMGSDNAGGEWDFYLPARPGDTIISHCTPVDARVQRGRRAGIFVITYSECRLVNQRGELVAKHLDRVHHFSLERQREIGPQAASYPPLPPGLLTRSPGGSHHRFYFPPDGPLAPLTTPQAPARTASGDTYAKYEVSAIPRRYDHHNVYFEDVQEGMEIPELVIGPLSTDHNRRWEMYIMDYWRPEFKLGNVVFENVPDFYAAGSIQTAWFGSMLTRWAGPNAWIRKLSYQTREWMLVGYKYFCRGQVVKKYAEDGSHYVECSLILENEPGVVKNPGHAVVELLSRGR